jgi:hypothetical protein
MADITSALAGTQVLTAADGKVYEDSLHRWCENAEKKAKYVVLPTSAEEVSKAVSRDWPRAKLGTESPRRMLFPPPPPPDTDPATP